MTVVCRLGLVCLGLSALTFRGWAADRSDDDKLWAFQRPKRVSPPAAHAGANPIDAFIRSRLDRAGLTPSPEASREVLIRRVTFDLIGLPPTPEDVAAFVRDEAPDAYEHVVDRLLASPQYGERWALFWLDLVRYAESDGFKADDARPTAWRYRDYVIHSFNRDKPYDRFIREQLAGDELYPDDDEAVLATGFLRHYGEEYNAVNLELRRQEILNDITDTTGQVFLGLTLGCARCHDHKFDPITQKDYYRLQAFFAAFLPADAALGTPDEKQRYHERMQEWEAKTAELRRELNALEEPQKKKFMASRMSRFSTEYQAMYNTPPDKRTPLQQQFARMVANQVEAEDKALTKGMKSDVLKQWQELSKRLADFAGLKPAPLPSGLAMSEIGSAAPPTFLLKRGDIRTKGREVEPGYLSALDDKTPELSTTGRTTGRRTALARWLTEPEHPLTARVMVNRLWQHHFGRGLVATPSDFGAQGEPPTHPELLDWLAADFTGRGWSLKAVHRLMVTSTTYRQTSANAERGTRSGELSSVPRSALRAPSSVDPDNKLLWRMNRRRLEGEALRDAMLAASGQLNPAEEGPSVHPELPTELGLAKSAWPVETEPAERNRRSIYVFLKRNLRYPLFSAFDAPDSNETCARRNLSTNAPQALMLLNDKLILDQARAFAGRVLSEASSQAPDIIERAYRLALARPPRPEEMQSCLRFLERQTSSAERGTRSADLPSVPHSALRAPRSAVADLCHVLFNLNEFLYVD